MKKVPASVWIMALILVGVLALVGLTLAAQKQTFGDVKLPVQIVEYFDYECPHCAEFYPILKGVSDKYGDKVQITYKNYAFLHEPSFPDDSTVFAYAAEAAGLQGKGLEYHDAIFTLYDKVLAGTAQYSEMDVVKIAQSLNLDMTKFNADRASDVIIQKVAADKAAGAALGVTSTPSVFVYGQSVEPATVNSTTGAVDYSVFTNLIDQLVTKATANTK